MTDKEIILKTIEFLKHKEGAYTIKKHWDEKYKYPENTKNEDKLKDEERNLIDKETQLRIKIKLSKNNLARSHIYNNWDLMLTERALEIKEDELNEDGNLKSKPWSEKSTSLFIGGAISIVSACIGATLPSIIESVQGQHQESYIVIPKVDTIHDTIIVKDSVIFSIKK